MEVNWLYFLWVVGTLVSGSEVMSGKEEECIEARSEGHSRVESRSRSAGENIGEHFHGGRHRTAIYNTNALFVLPPATNPLTKPVTGLQSAATTQQIPCSFPLPPFSTRTTNTK